MTALELHLDEEETAWRDFICTPASRSPDLWRKMAAFETVLA